MTSDFGHLLGRLIEAGGFPTASAFARQVGFTRTYIYKLLDGERPAPPEHLERMIAVLELDGQQRYEFIVAAALSHVPIEFHPLIAQAHRKEAIKPATLASLVERALMGVLVDLPPAGRRRRTSKRPSRS